MLKQLNMLIEHRTCVVTAWNLSLKIDVLTGMRVVLKQGIKLATAHGMQYLVSMLVFKVAGV